MDLITFAAVLGLVAGAVALPIWPACGGSLRRGIAAAKEFRAFVARNPST